MLAGQAVQTARASESDDFGGQGQSGDPEVDEEGLQVLDVDEARLVQAMTARIMPSDEVGPGAVEAGVVYFIDRQLNNEWGDGGKWYMEPPFVSRADDAKPNQGWQSRLTPKEAYKNATDWIQQYAQQEYGNGFLDLSEEEQDEVLMALENNEVDTFRSIRPTDFFTLLRTNTLEGMYCDPMYGGNRDMAGWKMKRFPGSPGALGSYKDLIDRGEFVRIPPRSIEDDVEAVGIESGTSSGDQGDLNDDAVSHHHGPRFELEDESESDDGDDGGEN